MAILQTVSGSYLPPSSITTVLREQLDEAVSLLDPFNTPIWDMLPAGSAQSPVVQWIVDSLPNLVLNSTAGAMDIDGINVNGVLEGFDVTYATGYPQTGQPSRVTNFIQTFAGRVAVSDILKAGNPAGIRNPYNHEAMKTTKAIKKAIERRLFDNPSANASYVAGAAGTAAAPWRTKTFHDFISTNQITVNGLLDTDDIDAGLEMAEGQGGSPEVLAVGIGTKIDLSQAIRKSSGNFSSYINMATINATERRVIRAVDFYEGDYGTPLAIVACRHIPESSATTGGGRAYLFEKAKLGKLTYRPLQHVPLSKTGDNTKGYLVTDIALKVANEKAHVRFNGVTT